MKKWHVKNRYKYIFILVVLIAALFVVGCAEEKAPPPLKDNTLQKNNNVLQGLLPKEEGYFWVYGGFAEYGHKLELMDIQVKGTETKYLLAGEADDPSGGEAQRDFGITLEYTIRDGVLSQSYRGSEIMDTFPTMELIRLPLEKGHSWGQTVVDEKGKEYPLICSIIGVEEEKDGTVYVVEYKDKNSNFYEKRRIQGGRGVVSFEKLMEGQDESFVVGYDLYGEASGSRERVSLNSLLPPLNTTLRYYGLAEYAHEGQMEKVTENTSNAVYIFNGTFQDGSGIPGQFKVQYTMDYEAGTIQEKVEENTRSNKAEINSKLHDPIIIKLPLEVGNSWKQEILFAGEKREMKGQIVSITFEGRTYYNRRYEWTPVITVQYLVEGVQGYFNNIYLEERRFRRGLGMIGYSNLMKGDLGITNKDNPYKIEEAIINNMFGYSLNRP